jgi:hypothetical protein
MKTVLRSEVDTVLTEYNAFNGGEFLTKLFNFVGVAITINLQRIIRSVDTTESFMFKMDGSTKRPTVSSIYLYIEPFNDHDGSDYTAKVSILNGNARLLPVFTLANIPHKTLKKLLKVKLDVHTCHLSYGAGEFCENKMHLVLRDMIMEKLVTKLTKKLTKK